MVRKGISEEMRSIIFMDPPDHRHMRSLLNKAFTPRAIQSQHDTVHEVIDKYLGAADPGQFDVVQDFSGPFPVEVITRMAGVPEEYRQQVRHWIDISLSREPGQIELGEAGMQANIDTAMYYFGLVQQRRESPQDDMISRLIAAEVPGEDGTLRQLDDVEITSFATLLGGAGAETVTKLIGSAAVLFARNPDEWEKLKEDRSKVPAAVEELLRYEGPVQYNVRYTLKEAHVSGGTIPAGQAGVRDERRGEPRPGRLHRRRHLQHRPRPDRGAAPRSGVRDSQLPRRGTGPDGKQDRAGEAARLHAPLRGGLGRLQTSHHAECRRLAECAGEGVAMRWAE